MARTKRESAREKVLRVRLTEGEFRAIRAHSAGKTLSETARSSLLKGAEKEKETLDGWERLVAQIEQADTSRITESIRRLEEKLEDQIDMEKIMRYLNRILTESAKGRIAIEEYARRDMPAMPFQLWESDVKVQFRKYVEDWKNPKGGD
jgi:hypothetical protein